MPVSEMPPQTVMEPQLTPAGALHELTPREREVLSLMARGWSNSAIDRHLVIAPKTTERHISRVYQKLQLPESADAHRRVQAVLIWRSALQHDRSALRRRGA